MNDPAAVVTVVRGTGARPGPAVQSLLPPGDAGVEVVARFFRAL